MGKNGAVDQKVVSMALLDSSKQAWLAAPGASRHDVESSGSSVSLLHSIYGSQASQLPISDYGSETSWGRSQTELAGPARSVTSLPARRMRSRPMSSPASVIAARQVQRKMSSALVESPIIGSSVTSLEEDDDHGWEVAIPRRPARPYSAAVTSSGRPSRPASVLSRPPSARTLGYPSQGAHQTEGRRLPRPQSAAVTGTRSFGAAVPPQRRPPSAGDHQRRQRPRTALPTSTSVSCTSYCISLRITFFFFFFFLPKLLFYLFLLCNISASQRVFGSCRLGRRA